MGEGTAGGALPLAGDIIAASAALAGFILVYLSALATGYATFPREARNAVRASYRTRAWFAFAGILFSVSASATATLAKFNASPLVAGISLFLFALTLFWAILSAAFLALEIE
jgi:hypothetical protein